MNRGEVDERQLKAINVASAALTGRPGAYIVCLSRENVEQLLACINRLNQERLEAKKSAGVFARLYHGALAGMRAASRRVTEHRDA